MEGCAASLVLQAGTFLDVLTRLSFLEVKYYGPYPGPGLPGRRILRWELCEAGFRGAVASRLSLGCQQLLAHSSLSLGLWGLPRLFGRNKPESFELPLDGSGDKAVCALSEVIGA